MISDSSKITYRLHALERMIERGITPDAVERVISSGQSIEEYPNDVPYPSRLILGFADERPIHVVVAENTDSYEYIVVTVYEPDRRQWDEGFRKRKK